MTWKIFLNVIKETKFCPGSLERILDDLFRVAGRTKEFELTTAKTWIYRDKSCDVCRYFGKWDQENVDGVFDFFRKRPIGKLRQLQEGFRKINNKTGDEDLDKDDIKNEEGPLTLDADDMEDEGSPLVMDSDVLEDEDSPLDLDTDDMDRFAWSLVNQVIDLLGFQRVDIPSGEEDEEEKEEESREEVENNQSSVVHESQAELAIADQYRYCLFCEKWKGNRMVALKDSDGIYGTCRVYKDRDQLSTEGRSCSRFKPDFATIHKAKFMRTH